jgi:hypothetical protein
MNKMAIGGIRLSAARRMATGVLAAMVVIYLSIITFAFLHRLDSTRHLVGLAILWCLGIVALGLLLRSWRHTRDNRICPSGG